MPSLFHRRKKGASPGNAVGHERPGEEAGPGVSLTDASPSNYHQRLPQQHRYPDAHAHSAYQATSANASTSVQPHPSSNADGGDVQYAEYDLGGHFYDGDEVLVEEEDESDDDDLFKFTRPRTGQTDAHVQAQLQGTFGFASPASPGLDPPSPGAPVFPALNASNHESGDVGHGHMLYSHHVGTLDEEDGDPQRPPTSSGARNDVSLLSRGVDRMDSLSENDAFIPEHLPSETEWKPPGTTEAQRIARSYKQQRPRDGPEEGMRSGADQALTTTPDVSGMGKRRQPYAYPGSPLHSAAPPVVGEHSPQYARHPGPAAAGRLDTPVIELANDLQHAHPQARLHSNGMPQINTHVGENSAFNSFPPEYSSPTVEDDTEMDDVKSVTSRNTSAKSYATSTFKKRHSPPIRVSSIIRRGPGSGPESDSIWNGANDEHLQYNINRPFPRMATGDTFELSELGGDGGANGFPTSTYFANGTRSRAGGTARGQSTASGVAVGVGADDDKLSLSAFQLEEEDSPYAEVAASVSNYDDPMMPCLTFKAIFLGIVFTAIGAAFNFFFVVRYPSPMLTPITIQVLSYPAGRLLDRILPVRDWPVPKFLVKYLGFPPTFSLNPGPFNVKEHTIITIMANVSISPAYALNFTLVLDKFYNDKKGVGFDILMVFTTSIIGFSFAGLCRRFLVWPASLIWPQNLVTCTLFNTFHAEEDDPLNGITRFRMFTYVAVGAFFWYFFPGFIFTGLSTFSFLCWIWPRQRVVNQLFGIASGLGMSSLTFDWSQVAYICSPLFVPWFALVNIFVGFVIIYWILVPIFYYTNSWNFAYMPISATGNFDRFGLPYNISMVLTADNQFSESLYQAYSPLFVTTTYAVVYALSFCLATASVVHTVLFHGKEIYEKFRNIKTEEDDVHAKLMRNYPEVPDWWYLVVFLFFTGMAIIMVELYKTELPVYALLLAILISALYVLPGGYMFALTAQLITVNLLAEMLPGYIMPGKPIANMVFKTFSIQCLQAGIYFVQDLKLGHYMKIPPRTTFNVQLIATIVASLAQIGVKKSLELLVPDLCHPDQAALLTCPISSVTFEASIIWGIIGPRRFFGQGSPYQGLLYFMLLGIFLPIPFYLAAKKWPNSFARLVNIPVMINGVTFSPPACGINYSSWFLTGAIFQYYLRHKRFRWWSRFNFVTSAALDGGTVLSTVFIFFTLHLPKNGGLFINWWGNNVYTNTADWLGLPFKDAPPEGFGPTQWT